MLLKGEDRMELKMPIVIMEFFKNTSFIYSLKILLLILTVIFIAYYFSKEGKDERGRGIIATSCVRGIMVLFVLLNICSYYTYSITSDMLIYTSAITLTYDLTLLTIIANIAVLRVIR